MNVFKEGDKVYLYALADYKGFLGSIIFPKNNINLKEIYTVRLTGSFNYGKGSIPVLSLNEFNCGYIPEFLFFRYYGDKKTGFIDGLIKDEICHIEATNKQKYLVRNDDEPVINLNTRFYIEKGLLKSVSSNSWKIRLATEEEQHHYRTCINLQKYVDVPNSINSSVITSTPTIKEEIIGKENSVFNKYEQTPIIIGKTIKTKDLIIINQ